MHKTWWLAVWWMAVAAFPPGAQAQKAEGIPLPTPRLEASKPLMQALKERKSMREFSPQALSLQLLSDLLWAANGINRPESGHHTAPTAMDAQEIDIYVVRADGAYRYDPRYNMLLLVNAQDVRAVTGKQDFVATAPVNLVFVADMTRMKAMSAQEREFYAATDTGFISQNVYLFCASAGLATVVRGWIDKPQLATALLLGPDQRVILAQTVGYPAKKTP